MCTSLFEGAGISGSVMFLFSNTTEQLKYLVAKGDYAGYYDATVVADFKDGLVST
jgi:hypothetical protein